MIVFDIMRFKFFCRTNAGECRTGFATPSGNVRPCPTELTKIIAKTGGLPVFLPMFEKTHGSIRKAS
ncbi:Uncharacterized protein dnm_063740 [Desulfonema magnum]|uniref:Uncharacterized protein n=1 Tax=Desulfonema magnum TaxID=45655 RepID=A0A975GRT8_9BACT|nr:Uncharacterized protein dnm_063740 [Desulfonema magnum]